MTDDVAERYGAALEERGLEDVRPLYRELLVRLKKDDPDAYEEGVRRYREEVEPAMEEGGDPLGRWLGYGAWLAARLTEGELAAVAPDGAASELQPADGSGSSDEAAAGSGLGAAAGAPDGGSARAGRSLEVPPGTLLLHLPEDDGEPAIPLAVPAEPTVHQEAAREILCG